MDELVRAVRKTSQMFIFVTKVTPQTRSNYKHALAVCISYLISRSPVRYQGCLYEEGLKPLSEYLAERVIFYFWVLFFRAD